MSIPVQRASPRLSEEAYSNARPSSPTSATIAFLEEHPETLTTATIGEILKNHKEAVLASAKESHQEEVDAAYAKGKAQGREDSKTALLEADENYDKGVTDGKNACAKTHQDLEKKARQQGLAYCKETHKEMTEQAHAEGVQKGLDKCRASHLLLESKALVAAQEHTPVAKKQPTLTRSEVTHIDIAPVATPTVATQPERIATVASYSLQTLVAALAVGVVIGSVVIALTF